MAEKNFHFTEASFFLLLPSLGNFSTDALACVDCRLVKEEHSAGLLDKGSYWLSGGEPQQEGPQQIMWTYPFQSLAIVRICFKAEI